MKKILLLTAVMSLTFYTLRAQNYGMDRTQNVFVEVMGNGLFYSVNYDTRFSGSDGLGARGGIGYIAIAGASLTSIPVMVNYLFGKEKHYFEVGGGATYVFASTGNNFGPMMEKDSGSALLGTLNLGYRFQPADGGIMFRGGLTPFFGAGNFWPFWPQASIGYTF